jgi:hypothetical protein
MNNLISGQSFVCFKCHGIKYNYRGKKSDHLYTFLNKIIQPNSQDHYENLIILNLLIQEILYSRIVRKFLNDVAF